MTNGTCLQPDCVKTVVSRGRCKTHYNRWRESFPPSSGSPTCLFCGAENPPKRAAGPAPSYCSQKCRLRASDKRNRARWNAEKVAKAAERRANTWSTCQCCGADFNPKQARSRFCSRRCQRAWEREHERGECSAPECARPIRARGVCNMHYKRILRDEGKLKPPPWDDAKRDAKARREALKRGNRVGGPVVLAKIAERDGWKCGICGKHVRESLTYPHPLSKSLDHVIPLSRGGAHSPENAQLAHLRCNVRKGNRNANDQLALIG